MEGLKIFFTSWWGILITVLISLLLIIVLYKPIFKAFFDWLLSFLAIIILSPIFIILAIIVKATSKGPVFFRQKRVGKNKKIFKIHKFRTMRTDAPKDCPTHLLENPDMYITKIGKFLRKTSLDELPQIFDIFLLKMSIVGPRPALWNQDDLVAERDKYNANSVRPGVTGLAQVSGRDELEIPVKAKFDGEYIKNINIFSDIKIFIMTFLKVLKSDGYVEGGTGTIHKSEIKREDKNIEAKEYEELDNTAKIDEIEFEVLEKEQIQNEQILVDDFEKLDISKIEDLNIEESIDNGSE